MNIKEIKETIEKAIQILQKNGWTKNVSARDHRGKHVYVDNPSACEFCLMGAIFKAENNIPTESLQRLNTFVVERRGYNRNISCIPVAAFNDACETKEEVIQLLRDFYNSLGE